MALGAHSNPTSALFLQNLYMELHSDYLYKYYAVPHTPLHGNRRDFHNYNQVLVKGDITTATLRKYKLRTLQPLYYFNMLS